MKLLSTAARAVTIISTIIALSNPSIAQPLVDAITVTPIERHEILKHFEETAPAVFELSLPLFLTSKQAALIAGAYKQAMADQLPDPRLLPGILMQETKAAGDLAYLTPQNQRSLCYGIFQVKVGTAQHVLNVYPELKTIFQIDSKNQSALRQRLIYDDKFNTAIASKYMLILMTYGYRTNRELALAFNQGMAGARNKNPHTFYYSTGVVKHITALFEKP